MKQKIIGFIQKSWQTCSLLALLILATLLGVAEYMRTKDAQRAANIMPPINVMHVTSKHEGIWNAVKTKTNFVFSKPVIYTRKPSLLEYIQGQRATNVMKAGNRQYVPSPDATKWIEE